MGKFKNGQWLWLEGQAWGSRPHSLVNSTAAKSCESGLQSGSGAGPEWHRGMEGLQGVLGPGLPSQVKDVTEVCPSSPYGSLLCTRHPSSVGFWEIQVNPGPLVTAIFFFFF